MGYLLLIIAFILNASASILLKSGALHMGYFKEYGLVGGLIKNYTIVIAMVLFVINIFFYYFALSKVPLSIAYPVMMVGGLTIITIVSCLFFKETLTTLQIIGLFMIVSGIFLVSEFFKTS